MFAQFQNLATALQGSDSGEEVEEFSEQELEEQDASETSEEEEQPQTSKPSLWNGLYTITNTVKQRAAEVAASVRETDWRSELNQLEQGFREDTTEISHKAKAATGEVVHKAKNVAEQAAKNLPGVVEHLPGQAGVLLQNSAKGAQQHLTQATRSISTLGGRVVVGASDLFDQVSHAIQNEMALQDPTHPGLARTTPSATGSAAAVKYSRYEADVAAMQRDSSTYCDEPDDLDNFEAFLKEFNLEGKKPDIDKILAENTFMSELQARIVPLIVEYDVFWTRYFYRLYKLEQKHEQFVQLTQRVEQDVAEEVGWGSDEDLDVELQENEHDAMCEAEQIKHKEVEVVQQQDGEQSIVGTASLATATTQLPLQEEVATGSESDSGDKLEDTTPAAAAPIADDVAEPKLQQASTAEEAGSQPTSEDDKTFVASTVSDGSDNSGKEPWCEVTETTKSLSDEKQQPVDTPTATVPATAVQDKAEDKAKEAKKEEDTKKEAEAAVDEEDDDFGSLDDDDVPVAEGVGADADLDEDWGDDVADWE